MQTVTVTEKTKTIPIGKRGENEVTEVVFDISSFVEQFGSGTAELIIKRPADVNAYAAEITQAENSVSWVVNSTDTDQVGRGKAELFWYVSEQLAKSIVYITKIEPDIGNTGEVPPPPFINVPTNWINGNATGSVRTSGAANEDLDPEYSLGRHALAEGYSTKASGENSHAEGGLNVASGDDSHAEGTLTEASGYASHAEGSSSVSSGYGSHAEGEGCIASGRGAHAEGYQTQAQGDYSHAEGNNTIAEAGQHVFGMYNETNSEMLEIVGNGQRYRNPITHQWITVRRNARMLDALGNEILAGSLVVGDVLTLGYETDDEVTITAAQLKALLELI